MHGHTHLVVASAVALYTLQLKPLGEAPVAVHDEGDMLRHRSHLQDRGGTTPEPSRHSFHARWGCVAAAVANLQLRSALQAKFALNLHVCTVRHIEHWQYWC